MRTTRLLNWEEDNLQSDGELGEGLTEAELYFWADRKREQNWEHFRRRHELCPRCKNCLCGERLPHDAGFRCVCAFGKKMLTPYRIRFTAEREKANHLQRRIYCLTHHIYESKGLPCS